MTNPAGPETANVSYLLVVQFLRLTRLEELQQVPECSLIVVSERIPWTVPVPSHHTTRQGGRTTKGRKEGHKGCTTDGGEKVMVERKTDRGKNRRRRQGHSWRYRARIK